MRCVSSSIQDCIFLRSSPIGRRRERGGLRPLGRLSDGGDGGLPQKPSEGEHVSLAVEEIGELGVELLGQPARFGLALV